MGASAGLNLVADALPAPWTFEDGSPVPVPRSPPIVARLGLDANPLDANPLDANPLDANAEADADADWLRACVWPGEAAREDRLELALAAFRAARTRADAPVLTPVVARHVPARLDLLSAAHPDALVVAYQTVVRDYLSPDERDAYAAGMRGWIAPTRPARRSGSSSRSRPAPPTRPGPPRWSPTSGPPAATRRASSWPGAATTPPCCTASRRRWRSSRRRWASRRARDPRSPRPVRRPLRPVRPGDEPRQEAPLDAPRL